ncbi:HIT-like protein [Phellopilus nigrolimitatus]|nr:HIT-like protein [Phellopilus nigrolimitatus]
MTSFIIDSHVDRRVSPMWTPETDSCPFCHIVQGKNPAHKVYENEKVVVILDILPLRPGHVLVIPKEHYSHLSELPEDIAGALGQAVSKVANALTKAMDNNALNVVCNQEYAQAVPHVHYHIIPAPTFDATSKISALPSSEGNHSRPLSRNEMHRKEFEAREELDDEDAKALVQKIAAKL